MYYRVAIQRQADQLDGPPIWQWRSTALSSLETLFQFLRLYRVLPQYRLRVVSPSERKGLEEQLEQENQGLGSPSVTAAHFLQSRLLHAPEVTQATPTREAGASQQMASIAVATHSSVQIRGGEGEGLIGGGMSALERKRLERELGPGGDHDVPYRFVLPPSMPQVFAWMRLMGRVQRGEVEP